MKFWMPGVAEKDLERVYARLATFNGRPALVEGRPQPRVGGAHYRDGLTMRSVEVGRTCPDLFGAGSKELVKLILHGDPLLILTGTQLACLPMTLVTEVELFEPEIQGNAIAMPAPAKAEAA